MVSASSMPWLRRLRRNMVAPHADDEAARKRPDAPPDGLRSVGVLFMVVR
jgi:hypothetical protein